MPADRPASPPAGASTGASAGAARPRRRRAPAEKREKILAAAAARFAARGYAGTATADVARDAGVSEGVLFHHFGSKSGLLQAVAERYAAGLGEAMFGANGPGDRPAGGAEGMLRRAFDYARRHGPPLPAHWLTPEAELVADASRRALVARLADAFAHWQEAGLVRPLDAPVAAELLHALVEAALRGGAREGGAGLERWLLEAARCIEGAVGPRPPA